MQTFTAAATQVHVDYRDLEASLQTHLGLIEATAAAGCRLVVFPELSVTGHNSSPDVVQHADVVDGRLFRALQAQAKACDIVVGYGFCEAARGTHYNAFALVGPQGLIGVQRKVHASHDEFFRFRQAYEWNVFDLGFCRAGVIICHDTSYFESWRVLALKGAEVILSPHSIRKMIGDLANHRVNCRSNGVFMIYSDQVGFDGHSDHVGGAYVLDPTGRMIARTTASNDTGWIRAELDAEASERIRRHTWFPLKQRRPETYGELTRQV